MVDCGTYDVVAVRPRSTMGMTGFENMVMVGLELVDSMLLGVGARVCL
jgi:hypothetical protein